MISAFAFAFLFSFLGSIPPGTLNLTILQLGLENKLKVAWRFSVAAALIEYPYAWLAVRFDQFIQSTPALVEHLPLLTGVVMITLGIFNLRTSKHPSKFSEKFQASGFRRGIVLSLLNPLALPYWVGITTYLSSLHWIELSSAATLHAYLIGVSLGALALFVLLAYLARTVAVTFKQSDRLKRVPGVVLLLLGFYALMTYLL